MAKPRYTAKQVIEALQETKGLVYLAAKKLGCDPETIHNYAKRHVAVKQAMQTARGEMVDVAEAKLYQAVQGGEQWAVLFSLRTQGKERGYVERVQQEVTGADRGPLKVEAFDYAASIAAIAPRPGEDSDAPSEGENSEHGSALGEDADGG